MNDEEQNYVWLDSPTSFSFNRSLHLALHAPSVLNLFALPLQPPYMNRSHAPESLLKYQCSKASSHGPESLAS